jgi:hypothetical protein
MGTEKDALIPDRLYYRLIALWVICEAVAGGIVHGFHVPFAGMIVSGFAVICICLIGYYFGSKPQKINQSTEVSQRLFIKGAILKATIIVCIFKMMLSPHTPPTAYFAVFFQGLMGQILFINLKHFRISCMILGFLALVEAAIQRVLVLVILYGSAFWNAVNEFIKKLIHVNEITNYSWLLAIGYVFIHAVVGILIGLKAAQIIQQSQSWKDTHSQYLISEIDINKQLFSRPASPRKRKVKRIFFIIWIILILLFIQSVFKIGHPVISLNEALQIFFRSLLIFLTWYFLLSPLITVWIKKRLQNQKEKSKSDISRIVLLLPATENILRKSWEISASGNGLKRLGLFWKVVLMNTLRND